MMHLILYIAKHGNALDRAIDFCTGRDGFSHGELRFSDGICGTSTTRGGDFPSGLDGMRYKRIDGFDNLDRVGVKVLAAGGVREIELSEDRKWVCVPLPEVGRDDEALIRAFTDDLVYSGVRYDYAGVVDFIGPLDVVKQDPAKRFCTEYVAEALQLVGRCRLSDPPHRVSPNLLARAYGAVGFCRTIRGGAY